MSSQASEFNWQCALITAVDGDWVKLEFQPLRHCRRCLRGEGCGAGVFSRLLSPRASQVWLRSSEGLQAGQLVRVGVKERELLWAAGFLYGFPLVSFILAAGLVATVINEPLIKDLVALLAGLTAGAVSVWLSGRLRGRILNPRLQSLSGSAGDVEP